MIQLNNSILDRASGRYMAGQSQRNPSIRSIESICGDSVELGRVQEKATYIEFPSAGFQDARSVDFWFRPRADMRDIDIQLERLLSKDGLQYGTGDFGIYMVKNDEGEHQILAKTSTPGATDYVVSCSSKVELGKWHHLGVSFTSNTTNIFLDGMFLDGTGVAISVGEMSSISIECVPAPVPAPPMNPPENPHEWLWGAGNTNLPTPLSPKEDEAASDFQGHLDELRFLSRPMTPEEAADTYERGLEGKDL